MSFKREVIEKLEKIETKLNEQTTQLAINNAELKEHTKRSTNLEERVAPLEQSHVFMNKLSKSVAWLVALVASLAAIYHYLILPLK